MRVCHFRSGSPGPVNLSEECRSSQYIIAASWETLTQLGAKFLTNFWHTKSMRDNKELLLFKHIAFGGDPWCGIK